MQQFWTGPKSRGVLATWHTSKGNPVGVGESEGKGWRFDQKVKIFSQVWRVGKDTFIKSPPKGLNQ